MRFRHGVMAVCAFAVGVAATGCQPASRLDAFSGETMGTTYTVKVVVDRDESGKAAGLGVRIQQALDDINSKMSTYDENSELSRFNDSESTDPFPMSPETVAVFAKALDVSEATDGAFDITVGPLVDAWGFGPKPDPETPPTDEELAALRERVGYTKLEVDPKANTVRKTNPDMRCDLSAIAKGYAVDRVGEMLESEGFVDYMVEVGGEVRTGGLTPAGMPWRIAIEKPLPSGVREVESVVPLSNYSMATSGDYRNFIEFEGQTYSHEIDPRTGRPVRHKLASVSVMHEEDAMADAYATGLMVLGPQEGLAKANELGLTAVFLVHTDDGGFGRATTDNFVDLVERMRAEAAPAK